MHMLGRRVIFRADGQDLPFNQSERLRCNACFFKLAILHEDLPRFGIKVPRRSQVAPVAALGIGWVVGQIP